MPVHYELDSERRLVITRAEGTVAAEDFRELRRTLAVDPRAAGMNHLVDLRSVSQFDLPGFEVQELARSPATDDVFGPGPLIAIVTDSEVGFGLARTYELTVGPGGGRVEVFGDLEQAEAWLAAESPDA